MNIEQYAAANNLDQGALACLMVYLQHHLTSTPEKAHAFRVATPEQRSAVIKQGVEAWARHSREWLTELYEGKTEAAIEARKKIAHQVWAEIRQKAGLPC